MKDKINIYRTYYKNGESREEIEQVSLDELYKRINESVLVELYADFDKYARRLTYVESKVERNADIVIREMCGMGELFKEQFSHLDCQLFVGITNNNCKLGKVLLEDFERLSEASPERFILEEPLAMAR